MNKVLTDIKAVRGVTGVAILDLEKSVTYRLLPTDLETEQVRRLSANLLELCQMTKDPLRLDLKFDNGVAVLVKLNGLAIFVYGRPSLNQSLLKLVLKSSISAVEGRFQRKAEETREISGDEASGAAARAYVEPLVETINQISAVYTRYVGTYLLAQKIREAREKLAERFPCLTAFFTDNNGMVSMMKSGEGLREGEVVVAFARWISLLRELCWKVSPEIRNIKISDLTSDTADRLEEMGFYQLCDD